ncbi:uncharacterized protein TRIADDRAFT_26054 [Trichoplax adhaerens]|uniref:ELMO domain-containing protein n=1 Tax=Trichoplax adhaerens TaxID=10228 RepID=B3RYS8_TRIAD|nr:hypothetical protein TRIADDRAFT_26054 [Trichoplax adhaerens]EDV25094.1 hypothetical protein TRIADDRAFT_26054 [Trichoplax adhaerens]|eukprot:XP_002112984.1 hypothetical protein TRIADDRAFT_26054 [Trichoplax adhaerens]
MKSIYRWLTGTCELQRICKSCNETGDRTTAVEKSLGTSKTESLRKITTSLGINVNDAVQHIAVVKKINHESSINSEFICSLSKCLVQICTYSQLKDHVETIRSTTYDSNNKQHETMLMKLWDLLCPDNQLEQRISPQWTEIGFQGSNPETDFRGMGLLGLEQLVYFTENYTQVARKILSHSHHPTYGYSMAIVGIHLTNMAYSLLVSNALKPHFYYSNVSATLDEFHKVYCYLIVEFDSFWRSEKPENILIFNEIKEKFRLKTLQKLKTLRVLRSFELM